MSMSGNRRSKKDVPRRRLLLLSCSRRKCRTRKPLPAIERYDGPAFRVLRRYLRQHPSTRPDVLILSAKWGLIPGDTLLTIYNRELTVSRARELRSVITIRLREILESRCYTELFISMSDEYSKVIVEQNLFIDTGITIYNARGGRGRKLSELYDWLHGSPPPVPKSVKKLNGGTHDKPRLRGVEVQQTKAQALELALAHLALPQELKAATHIHSWYIQLNKKQISPKWLVSKLTGWPVSAFVTDEARRVLAHLGIEVRRVSNCHISS